MPPARCAGFWLRASDFDQAGPVGLAIRVQIDRDDRPLQRHVGDLDAADQQREKAQARGQPLGGERRPLGIAQHHVGETDAAGWKQRDGGLAAQDRIEAGDGADFAHRLLAHRVGRNQEARGHRARRRRRDRGEQDKSQAFEAGGGRQRE